MRRHRVSRSLRRPSDRRTFLHRQTGMLATFALTCFNQQRFIRDAVRGALAQDYEPLEILISDNHSTDGTFDIIQEELRGYSGPHSVRVIRQSRNIVDEIFPRTTEAAGGEFVVIAHGDDVSYPNRTRCLVEAWQSTKAFVLSSNAEIIDGDSHLLNYVTPEGEAKWFSAVELADGYTRYMHGATMAWHQDVFRKFEPLDNLRLNGGTYDHILPFRAALLGGSYHVPLKLLQWRVHGKNYGLQHANRTVNETVWWETNIAIDLSARICMLDDLDYFIKNGGRSKELDLEDLRKLLIGKILQLARDLCKRRTKLFLSGMRPTWISQAELEARLEASPAYVRSYSDTASPGFQSASPKLIKRMVLELARKTGTDEILRQIKSRWHADILG